MLFYAVILIFIILILFVGLKSKLIIIISLSAIILLLKPILDYYINFRKILGFFCHRSLC